MQLGLVGERPTVSTEDDRAKLAQLLERELRDGCRIHSAVREIKALPRRIECLRGRNAGAKCAKKEAERHHPAS